MLEYFSNLKSGMILTHWDIFLKGFSVDHFIGKFSKDTAQEVFQWSLQKSQYWPKEKQEKYTRVLIQKLLAHASQDIPFWKDKHLSIDKFNDLRPMGKIDFRAFPIDAFCDQQARSRFGVLSGTSGSTGVPFGFYIDKRSFPWRRALYRRIQEWSGKQPSDEIVRILNFERHGFEEEKNFIECSGPNELKIKKDFIDKSFSGKSVMLDGFASYLLFLARSYAGTTPPFKVRSLLSTAEMIGEYERNYLERTYSAPVFNCYVSRETGFIGTECEVHDGFHIHAEHIFFEILDQYGNPAMPGEHGLVTITTLDNFVMPLIRYQLGDIGTLVNEPCLCGRTLPRIRIEGRNLSWITLPNGRASNIFEFLKPVRKMMKDIIQYQLVQDAIDKLTFLIVPDRSFTQAKKEQLSHEISGDLGPNVFFTIQEVKKIPTSKSGKQQHFISHIATTY